ncbi:hypothetical protein Q3304_09060 [Clostridioides sp. GD02377]|uniref:hypothetical protein n=1 Tax=unclassified Clostridioides TaxID=2635829 RepID=UPI0038A8A502
MTDYEKETEELIKEVANKRGISEDEVIKKIANTIEFIKKHPDLQKQKWIKKAFEDKTPTPEELVYEIAKKLNP